MLHEVSSFCRAFNGYRVHCRDTQTFPVVPRHTLVSNTKDPLRIKRHKRLLWALKPLILLSDIFLRHPVAFVLAKLPLKSELENGVTF